MTTSNINQRYFRVVAIPNRFLENLNVTSSSYHLIDQFQAYPEINNGISMEIRLRKRQGDMGVDMGEYRYSFGLKVPNIMEGLIYRITHSFRLIHRDAMDFSMIADAGADGEAEAGADGDSESVNMMVENSQGIFVSDFQEDEIDFDDSPRFFHERYRFDLSEEGPGPFGMSRGVPKWEDICSDGYLIIALIIESVNTTVSPEFYQKMLFEKLYPEYLESEIGQLRNKVIELTRRSEEHAQSEQVLQTSHQKEILKMKDQMRTMDDVEKTLKRDVERYREDNSILTKKIKSLESEIADSNREVQTQELIKALSDADISKLRFKGSLTEKQNLQMKISDLMIQLAEDIRKDELCAICGDSNRSVAFKPCGHFYYCYNCYNSQKDSVHLCPMCTHEVEDCIRVQQ